MSPILLRNRVTYFSEEQIEAVLEKIVLDSIPVFILGDCCQLIKRLQLIYNLCMNDSIFPIFWKTSRICSGFKNKGDKSDICNYRPIMIICNFSQAFEVLHYADIYSQLQGTLPPDQNGFIKDRSTITNLTCTT